VSLLTERSRAGQRRFLVWGAVALAALLAVLVSVLLVARSRRRLQTVARASTAVDLADRRLPILSEVPPFDFTNIDGRSIDVSALRGHVWIADFLFTRCTTMCPITTAKMSVLRRSIPAADIRFVSFSIDPDYDTPAVLREYAERWNADSRWLILSSPQDKVTEFAKAMNVPFEHTAMPLEPILHSSLFFLIDQRGRVRGLYGSLDDAAVRRLVTDATLLDASAETPRDGGSQPKSEETAISGPSRGHGLFASLGCAACHADPKTGPPLGGLAGRTVRLQGGATVLADAAYLRRSILAPAENVVVGYDPLMPAYSSYLAAEDVDDLVAYLQSISSEDTGGAGRARFGDGAEANADVDVQDPVCGMKIKKSHATAHATYDGKAYYFCSERCRLRFMGEADNFAR
jgi:protein SCO1/2